MFDGEDSQARDSGLKWIHKILIASPLGGTTSTVARLRGLLEVGWRLPWAHTQGFMLPPAFAGWKPCIAAGEFPNRGKAM